MTNLPEAPRELIGRDDERAELVAGLRAGKTRLVTIIGGGGCGKTRLALAVAEAIVDVLADGAFFVALAQVSEPDAVPAAIAAPLGIHLHADGEHVQAIGLALSDRKLLLVLDNFEHLLGAAPLIAELLASAPQLRVMVTSQAPFGFAGSGCSRSDRWNCRRQTIRRASPRRRRAGCCWRAHERLSPGSS